MVQEAVNKFHVYRRRGAGSLGPVAKLVERTAGKCSPCLAGVCWQGTVAYRRREGRVLGQLAAAPTGPSPCPLSFIPAPSFLLLLPTSGLHFFLPSPAPSLALTASSLMSPLLVPSPFKQSSFLPVYTGGPSDAHSSPPCPLLPISPWHCVLTP